MRQLFASTLAAALLVAPATTASEWTGAPPQAGFTMPMRSADWGALLRAPEFDQVPWLVVLSDTAVTRRDLMAGPKVDTLEPFLLQPASPAAQFLSSWRFEPNVSIE